MKDYYIPYPNGDRTDTTQLDLLTMKLTRIGMGWGLNELGAGWTLTVYPMTEEKQNEKVEQIIGKEM